MDKRTKEYRDIKRLENLKKKKESKGLGDTVEKITKATGVEKVVKFMFGKDCKCDERKEKLNKWFPYTEVECLTHKEYKYLDGIFSRNKSVVSAEEQNEMLIISNRVFNQNKKKSNCSSCVRTMLNNLKRIYNDYDTTT